MKKIAKVIAVMAIACNMLNYTGQTIGVNKISKKEKVSLKSTTQELFSISFYK